MSLPKDTYTRQTLEETPERALRFLAGVGTSSSIRTQLLSRGYTEAEHQLGWKLLHTAAGYETPTAPPHEDRAAAQASAEIDAWDEPNFRLARASLTVRFAAQADFLFKDLSAATGAGSLLTVRTFLDRLDMLEGKRPGRDHKNKAQKQADADAVALLETRGITAAERARMSKLLTVAQSGAKPDPDAGKLAAEAAAQAAHREQALLELRGWYDEWAEVSRVVITRRDYLIRLGLAKRKTNKKGQPPTEPGTNSPPTT